LKKSWGISTWMPAVAGFTIGIDGAAVPNCLQRVDSGDHHFAAGLAVGGGNETDAAGIVFLIGVVGMRRRQGLCVAAPKIDRRGP